MKFNDLADSASINKASKALSDKRYKVYVVENATQVLDKIKEIIPKGASVMNGSSVTLEQIGYFDYLKSGKHGWIDFHSKVTSENDKVKRALIRRKSVLSDFYLGSVHALTLDGDFIIASNTGSQLPHVVYTSPNLIFVVSAKKLVSNLDMGMGRLAEYVYPLEDKNLMNKYNMHTGMNKILIFKGEAATSTRKINFILVKEDLGF